MGGSGAAHPFPGHVDLAGHGSAVTVFYGDLDPTRFQRDVARQGLAGPSLSVSGTIMLGLLVGNVVPLLSRNQAFDHQLILGLASGVDGAASDDQVGLFRLAREGYLKVGLLDRWRIDPVGDEKFTLWNAFRSALATPEMVFSGWPELNGDDGQELRRNLLARMGRTPGRITDLVEDHVARRIVGLFEFSENLLDGQKKGLQSVTAITPGREQLSLEERIRSALQDESHDSEGITAAARWIFDQAERRPDIDLTMQSAWITWADRYQEIRGDDAVPAAAGLKDFVNGQFIVLQGESHGAQGWSLQGRDGEAMRLLADRVFESAEYGERLIALAPQTDVGNWISWAQLPDLLGATAVYHTAEERLRYLEDRHANLVALYKSEHRLGVSLRVGMPAAVAAALTAATASLVPLPPAIDAGLGAGIVTLAVLTPVVRQAERRTLRKLEKMEARRPEKSIRAGSGAWPDRLVPRLREV